MKIGPEETPKLPYLRFASVTLYPSNEDLSLAIGSILRSFSYPTASLVCAKAECESLCGACLTSDTQEASATSNQKIYRLRLAN